MDCVGLSGTTSGNTRGALSVLYAQALSDRDRAERQQLLDRQFAEADASVALVGLFLRIVSPHEAPRFMRVASATVQIYKTLAAFDPRTSSKVVLFGGVATGILAFADAISEIERNAETEYIMSALAAIRQELHELQLSITELDVRVRTLLTAVERLEQNSTLQYSSLRNVMWDLAISPRCAPNS